MLMERRRNFTRYCELFLKECTECSAASAALTADWAVLNEQNWRVVSASNLTDEPLMVIEDQTDG